ncbi:MAG: geranylgeranylglyceryl/heptaprenylglyceryl phosphate synthase [Candidatus Bathyarchaeota archaeon]
MLVNKFLNVEKYLVEEIRRNHAIHLTLIDPENLSAEEAGKIAFEAEKAGTAAIMLGGSTVVSQNQVDNVAKEIKNNVKIPLILFPGNISGLSRFADAVFFMSLLNSSNTYYLIDAQALSALTVKNLGVEPIPLGYIVMGGGGTVGFIGYARLIPYDKPQLALMYALAGQYLGMRFIYLEAGSGAKKPIPTSVISLVKKNIDVPLIVGGGIRSADDAKKVVKAGADIIVTGTLIEKVKEVREKISEIVRSIGG